MKENKSFKENLLQKIELQRLASRVIASIGNEQARRSVDKEPLKRILELSPYQHHHERDLDLYVKDTGEELKMVLVLDNELPLFRSTVKDVVTRRSPRTLEMWKVSTIRRILVDSDIKMSKGKESVETILKDAVSLLDLTYTDADIEGLAREGMAWLAGKDVGEVGKSLAMFAELLGYRNPSKYFGLDKMVCYGIEASGQDDEVIFGPLVLYRPGDNVLLWIDRSFSSSDRQQIKRLLAAASGKTPVPITGDAVFEKLQANVLEKSERVLTV